MKVVFIKNNNFVNYKLFNINGYLFKPRNKNIKTLCIVKVDIIKYILSKKISNEIKKIKKIVSMMIDSEITIIDDCNMIINEIVKVSKKLEDKYRVYFSEFEYFELVKDLYSLNMEILLKKKLLEEKM